MLEYIGLSRALHGDMDCSPWVPLQQTGVTEHTGRAWLAFIFIQMSISKVVEGVGESASLTDFPDG